MSHPKEKEQSLLLISVMYPSSEENKLKDITETLEKRYGIIKEKSEVYDFNFTQFYEKEFGKSLKKVFYAFEKHIFVEDLPDVKIFCYELEEKYSKEGKRVFNIDSGYITRNAIILATFKPRPHRIYLRDGVYADLELVFENDDWKSLQWTFSDMKEERIKEFFKKIKKNI